MLVYRNEAHISHYVQTANVMDSWYVPCCPEKNRMGILGCLLEVWIISWAVCMTEAAALSRQKSFCEGSPVGSWFSKFMFRDVRKTVPDCTQTCDFRRNRSSLDRSPRFRLSVLLKSRDKFFVTLPFVFTDTWVIYYLFTLVIAEFHDWLFLRDPSWLSLATAANFLQFFKIAFS